MLPEGRAADVHPPTAELHFPLISIKKCIIHLCSLSVDILGNLFIYLKLLQRLQERSGGKRSSLVAIISDLDETIFNFSY